MTMHGCSQSQMIKATDIFSLQWQKLLRVVVVTEKSVPCFLRHNVIRDLRSVVTVLSPQ